VHQALLDPKGQYLLFPDLGADLVHVYAIEPQTNKLVTHSPLRSKKGYGPRHAVFWSPNDEPDSTFLFVIHELANKIVSYAVEYLPAGGLAFQEVDEVSTFGDREIPKTAAASEIVKVRYISLPCTSCAANTPTDTRQQIHHSRQPPRSDFRARKPGSQQQHHDPK
jgi:6-phosphogluconolactonase (cycloisomerase 2 family)